MINFLKLVQLSFCWNTPIAAPAKIKAHANIGNIKILLSLIGDFSIIIISPNKEEVKKAIKVKATKFSQSAVLKIEKAGQKPRQDQVYGTQQNYPSPSADLDMLDDDLNR